MDKQEIHKLALKAGAAQFYPKAQGDREDNYLVGYQFLERFAQLVKEKSVEDVYQLVKEKP